MSERTPLHERTAQAGAVFVESQGWLIPDHYGDPQAEYAQARQGAVLLDLSHTSKVEVSGPEAPSFLHNLCTNDINNLPLGGGCEAFFLNATARVLAHVRIYHVLLHGDRHAFWIDLRVGEGDKLIKHLDRHLISEQVELADRTREFAQMHLAGPQAKRVLEKALLDEIPDLESLQHMQRTFGDRGHSSVRRRDPLALPGYDIVCLKDLAPLVWDALVQAGARPLGLQACERLRVEAGTPIYGPDLDENRFAVEVGRTAQAICYTKGCYLGQEPIVMVRDRGQLQRLLLGVISTGTEPIPAGSKLFRDGKEVGQTTSSVVSPALGKPIALAYLRRGNQEPGLELELEIAGTRRPATVAPLPFPGTR